MDERIVLSVKEVAARIGKHYVTTLNLIYKGHLRAVKRGGTWYVEVAELERFIKDGNYEEKEVQNA